MRHKHFFTWLLTLALMWQLAVPGAVLGATVSGTTASADQDADSGDQIHNCVAHSLGLDASATVNEDAESLPISGVEVPSLSAFDRAMVDFMRARNIQAGTLAVARNGVLLLRRGYGWQDQEHQQIISPDALMRLAGVDQVLTVTAIKRLVQEGRLDLGATVFPLLNVTPPPGQIADPRLNDITIQHLLDQSGGWDQVQAGFDPYFESIRIAQALGIPSPATTPDIARYMAGQPLQFTPGTRSAYSNFGFALLRWVVEYVSGQSMAAYFQSDFGLDVDRSYALPQDRNPREIWYSSVEIVPSVYDPSSLVSCPDGGFLVESRTLAATSATLVDFLSRYWVSGEPRIPGQTGYVYWYYGSVCGTFTFVYQHVNGTNIAILFNQRSDPSGLSYDNIKEVMDDVIANVTLGPELLLSSNLNGAVNGLRFANEDILAHNPMTDAWALFFDGSDVGINGNVDAFTRLPDGDLLLSLSDPVWLPGVGLVDDSDVIRFTPTSLGPRTSGTFAWYFDGSDVGLTSDGEAVDAIAATEKGDLLISTRGRVRVPNVLAVDEDLLRFTPSRLGQNTAGRWTVFFDGSDVGLRESTEDVRGVWYDPYSADLYLTTAGDFRVPDLQGTGADIFKLHTSSLGLSSAGLFLPFWRGQEYNFGAENVDAFAILTEPWTNSMAASAVDDDPTVPEADEFLPSDSNDDAPDDDVAETTEEGVYELHLPFVSQEGTSNP